MSIQSNINQGLSLTGLLITQTAGYKNAAEAHKLDVKAKKVDKQIDIVASPRYNSLGVNKVEELKNLNKKAIELNKEAFETAPSKKRFETYSRMSGARAISDRMAKMRELADTNTKAAQEARLETRKRILTGTPSEYLLKEDK